MFDPQDYHLSDRGERLFAMGLELYRITRDEELAIPVIKAASDCGWPDASHLLARYWLAKTQHPEPHIWKDKINYRNAAEFALACDDKVLLRECFEKCSPGELDDIKFRRSGFCKNYDTESGRCVMSDDTCGPVEQSWCPHGNYTETRQVVRKIQHEEQHGYQQQALHLND